MKIYVFCAFFIVLLACAKIPNKTQEKIALEALGKALFSDTRLSRNGTKSCASCHAAEFAFTDGYRRSSGIEADETLRNAPSLYNTSFYSSLTWANPNITTFEAQMRQPLFKKHTPELGLDSTNLRQLDFLKTDTFYQKTIQQIFKNKKQSIDYELVIKAIATYERTLIDFNSPYDKYKKGDTLAISMAAKRGAKLFFSEALQCGKCHTYPLFTDANQHQIFHKIGYETANDLGVFNVTGKESDKGKFRTPSLRNVARTAPYMHDGGIEKLTDVIRFFEKANSNELRPFHLNEAERHDLLVFLESLSSQ